MWNRTLVALSVLALSACNATPKADPTSEPAPPPLTTAAPEVNTQAVAPAPTQTAVQPTALTRIEDPSTVCMINDQHMGVAQIPVQVEGRTYYGCCQMCEAKLKTNPQARLGTDPVSQKQVDKATAVLAKDASGKVLYFENSANMQAYASRL